MTIDERLDRLVQRHEALTQTVEHLALQSEEQNKHLDRILAALDKDGENIRALARIAEIHEHRISELEGGDS